MHTSIQNHHQRQGGRISSPKHRELQAFCADFTGLEDDVSRYDLLLLVKRVGKAAGFTQRMIGLLDYYMAYTRDVDWEEGGRPVVYQSLTRTALDLGVSERQIQKLEKQLFECGAITWNDSGNHRRYGVRCQDTGRILYAYGVDLAPLASLKTMLEDKLHDKQLYERAWMDTKRQISWYRAQIRAVMPEVSHAAEQSGAGDAEITVRPIRTYMSLEALRDLLRSHKALYAKLEAFLRKDEPDTTPVNTQKASPRDEQKIVHKESTNQQPSNKLDTGNQDFECGVSVKLPREHSPPSAREKVNSPGKAQQEERMPVPDRLPSSQLSVSQSVARPARATNGMEHLNWRQIMMAASERFMDRLVCQTAGMQRQVLAGDCVRAACDLGRSLGISHAVWAEGCADIGEQAASVCVILIDRAMHRPENPVQKPNGYFRSMIRKSRAGELHLHKSVFGYLKAGQGSEGSSAQTGLRKGSCRKGEQQLSLDNENVK